MSAEELWPILWRLGGALIVIIPLMYIVTHLYSRRMTLARSKRVLRIVDAVALGPNRNIYIVEVGRRLLVIGATPHQLSLLTEVTDEQSLQTIDELVDRP